MSGVVIAAGLGCIIGAPPINRCSVLFGNASISIADANKETPASSKPPYKLPVL